MAVEPTIGGHVSQPDRKALARAYKDNPRPAGIFAVTNTATGRILLGPTPDLPGMLNRQRFQLEMGSHPDKELQQDWNELGAQSFEIGVLDTLDPGDDATTDVTQELKTLHQMWVEKLSDTPLYRLSNRGL